MKTVKRNQSKKRIIAIALSITFILSFLPGGWPNPVQPIIAQGEIEIYREVIYHITPDSCNGAITQATWNYTGSLDGYSFPRGEPEVAICTNWIAQAKVRVYFSGTLENLEKGTFYATLTGESNPNLGFNKGLRAKLEIDQGTGTGGLEGICGGGMIKGLEAAPGDKSEAKYKFELWFGEDCQER
jgi:hypothetical protein